MKFKKSSSLKLLGQLELNFAKSFDGTLSKLCPANPDIQPTVAKNRKDG
jgi:hypothetical protein